MKTRQELIECMARADPTGNTPWWWDDETDNDDVRQRLRKRDTDHMEAVLWSLEAAGACVVPIEITDRMRVFVHDQTWANALNASPFKGE
jgi:hypothetical protein